MANQDILDMLNDRFDKMNDRFDKIDARFNDTNSRLEKLSNDVNEFRGDMTERNLRHEVRKMYGDTFGDVFVIQGVDGLIRLARGSKRQDSQYYPRDVRKVTGFDMRSGHNKSDSQRTRDSIDVLCNYLYNNNAGNIALERFLTGFGWTNDKIVELTKRFSVFNDVKEEKVKDRNAV